MARMCGGGATRWVGGRGPLIRAQSRMMTNTGLKYSLRGTEPQPKARLEELKCHSPGGNTSTDFSVETR
jgi:hypothetical protein